MRHSSGLTDAQLIESANRGDETAFNALYQNHRDWVVALARQFLSDQDEALDVMQEVFVELFRRFPGFVLTSSLRAYLYPAVKHRSISRLRKRAKVVPLDPSFAENTSRFCPSETRGDFQRMTRRLTREQQELIWLRFGLEMKLGEIADALNQKVGTIKSRLHYCLDKIRQDTKKN